MPISLITDQLFLREFSLDDAENLYRLNADPDVLKYTGDVAFQSIEEAKRFIESYSAYKEHGYGRWAVVEKSSNEFLGWCGFKYHNEGYVDLGFRFFKIYWNKGFATEASIACIQYGFDELGFNEIVGRTAEKNIASIKVLEKLGFVFWKKDACDGIEDARYYLLKKAKD